MSTFGASQTKNRKNWLTNTPGELTALYRSTGGAEISEELDTLTTIDDTISVAVKNQYEENPYPLWDSLNVSPPIPNTQAILQEITPYKPELVSTSDAPDVLVAGCGTGKQPISSALHYAQSNVLDVDLSRASLSFAKGKAEEFGVSNIRFAQADILELGKLDDRFDVIECSGVLHHMAEPEAGLRVLLDLLKPGGFIKLGLYSEVARQPIARIRSEITEKGYEPSLEGIRELREYLRGRDDEDTKAVAESQDFYSASMVRDLLFHVQEHHFTIPQIGGLIENSGLEFLGFMFNSAVLKAGYAERFPNDPDCLDLNNWYEFEEKNPRVFAGCISFGAGRRANLGPKKGSRSQKLQLPLLAQ